GVPLFLEELTRAVLQSDLLVEGDHAYRLVGDLSSLEIPDTLRGSLTARLDRLGTVRDVAKLGSVLGREFTYEMIRAIATAGEDELRQDLERLVTAELLEQEGSPPRAR